MAGLQRSAVSFRRQGSSGIVWDDRFLSEELNKANQKDEHEQQEDDREKSEVKELNAGTSLPPINTIDRSRSNGGGRGYRTGKVSPAVEPPSPKLSACGCCGAFGKTGGKGNRTRPGKRRSR
ncbi:MAPK kinase substrate protein At1g80180-like [Neltuma alba]|uniref:MAPK kinase substrate protein At1g80180-like n=1 Tax=Neltuma alba TaxID=207710 RepID=UPI0010A3956D|nr:MAPK kinase substrate protein At1g80180-like [Prosopis alba]